VCRCSVLWASLHPTGSSCTRTVCLAAPGRSQRNAQWPWTSSLTGNKDCEACTGYNWAITTVRHDPSYDATATTVQQRLIISYAQPRRQDKKETRQCISFDSRNILTVSVEEAQKYLEVWDRVRSYARVCISLFVSTSLLVTGRGASPTDNGGRYSNNSAIWATDGLGFISWQGQEVPPFYIACRLTLWPTHPLAHWVPGARAGDSTSSLNPA
jgi:hypothetical protein